MCQVVHAAAVRGTRRDLARLDELAQINGLILSQQIGRERQLGAQHDALGRHVRVLAVAVCAAAIVSAAATIRRGLRRANIFEQLPVLLFHGLEIQRLALSRCRHGRGRRLGAHVHDVE